MCNVANIFLLNIVQVTAQVVTDVSIGMSFSDATFTKYEAGLAFVAFSKFNVVKFFIINHHYHNNYDVAAFGSELTSCHKIDKPLVVYRFSGNVMASITTYMYNVFTTKLRFQSNLYVI